MKTSFILLFVVAWAAIASGEPAPGVFEFHYENGRCWLDANQAPVNGILTEVSRATGIPIVVDPADTSCVTVSIGNRDVETLINAVASGSAITYTFDPELKDYVIESVITAGNVDPGIRDKQVREMVRAQQRLDEKLAESPVPPVRYSGIGARIALSDDGRGVWLRPMSERSPAARAGIRIGDLVVAVDGKAVDEFGDLGQIADAMRGPANTRVELRILEPGGAIVTKYIIRDWFVYTPPSPM